MEKIEAHSKALFHRAVSVFIFNSNNQLLLQKQALSKYHSPDLWTNTACTHPRPNENTKYAAIRRLKKEMGMNVDDLTKIFDYIYKEKLDNELTEHKHDHVFTGFSDNKPVPNTREVCEFKYIEKETLLQQIQSCPNDYTVWFKKIMEQGLSHIK